MKKYTGDLMIEKDCEIHFEEITGSLKIKEGVKILAKSLNRVGGYLSIYSNATLPKLETVGGYLYINSNVTLDAPKLETVGGYLYINSNVTLDAPKLETVGGNLYINSNATLPKLETVGGDLSIYSNATLPKLETVGGYLSIYSNATLDAPKLKNKNDVTAKKTCQTRLAVSFKKKGLVKIDGILSYLFSRKKLKDLIVFKVKIVGKLKFSFIVQREQQFSHGETVKKAIESLRYKLSDRDTNEFKKWKLTTTISLDDAIQAYRAITGACELGVRNFCESIKVPEKLTVKKAIELTDGEYGSDKFAEFFK
jgi:hypothetical protein